MREKKYFHSIGLMFKIFPKINKNRLRDHHQPHPNIHEPTASFQISSHFMISMIYAQAKTLDLIKGFDQVSLLNTFFLTK